MGEDVGGERGEGEDVGGGKLQPYTGSCIHVFDI